MITWSSNNASTCITPWGSTATGGTYTTPVLTGSTSYSVSCSGVGGSVSGSVGVSLLDPGLPSWLPAPGRVSLLTQSNGKLTNTFVSTIAPYYEPYYSVKIVNDYSTSYMNPYFGDYGSIIFYGAGHSATNDNSVMALVLGKDTATFHRMTNPSPLF